VKSSKWFLAIVAAITLLHVVAAHAAPVDMNDPRRALGREDDVRVDAQLLTDTVSPGATLGAKYQIQNLTSSPVAVAEKVTDVSYDADTQTIVFAIGSEVPKDGVAPKLVVIAPGETKSFTAGGMFRALIPARGAFTSTPRLVQIKVNVLRNVDAFRDVFAQQARTQSPVALSDTQFDQWLESNDAILLNAIPVRFNPRGGTATGVDASQRTATRGF
jgi:hypothetical protein